MIVLLILMSFGIDGLTQAPIHVESFGSYKSCKAYVSKKFKEGMVLPKGVSMTCMGTDKLDILFAAHRK